MRLSHLSEDDYSGLTDSDQFGQPPTAQQLDRALRQLASSTPRPGAGIAVNDEWTLYADQTKLGLLVQLFREDGYCVYERMSDRFNIPDAIAAARA